MGKDSPSLPPAPNTTQLVGQQQQSNAQTAYDTAKLNRYNTVGPQGSVTWTNPDANGVNQTQTVSLTPQGQAIFSGTQDIQKSLIDKATGALSNVDNSKFTTSGLPYDPTQATSGIQVFNPQKTIYDPSSYGSMTTYADNVAKAFMDKTRSSLDPVFEQQQRRLDQQMTDRGLDYGGEAWTGAQGELHNAQNKAWSDAASNAQLAAGQEASRIFGMEQQLGNTDWNRQLQGNQQGNASSGQDWTQKQAIRAAALSDMITNRTQNMNEAMSYFNPVQLQSPTATAAPAVNIANTDIIGANMQGYNAQMQGYNAQQQQQAALWGALGTGAQTAASLFLL